MWLELVYPQLNNVSDFRALEKKLLVLFLTCRQRNQRLLMIRGKWKELLYIPLLHFMLSVVVIGAEEERQKKIQEEKDRAEREKLEVVERKRLEAEVGLGFVNI